MQNISRCCWKQKVQLPHHSNCSLSVSSWFASITTEVVSFPPTKLSLWNLHIMALKQKNKHKTFKKLPMNLLRRRLTFIWEDESKRFWDWRSRREFIWREGFTLGQYWNVQTQKILSQNLHPCTQSLCIWVAHSLRHVLLWVWIILLVEMTLKIQRSNVKHLLCLCFSIFSLWTECPITNATTDEPKGLILTLLKKRYIMFKIKTMRSKYFLKCWPSQSPGVTYCMLLEPDRTFKLNIFCKQWFSEKMTFLKASSYENKNSHILPTG